MAGAYLCVPASMYGLGLSVRNMTSRSIPTHNVTPRMANTATPLDCDVFVSNLHSVKSMFPALRIAPPPVLDPVLSESLVVKVVPSPEPRGFSPRDQPR